MLILRMNNILPHMSVNHHSNLPFFFLVINVGFLFNGKRHAKISLRTLHLKRVQWRDVLYFA